MQYELLIGHWLICKKSITILRYNFMCRKMQWVNINRIIEAIEGLNVFSKRVKLVESELEQIMGLRQLVIDNYSVFYVIEDMDVIVTRVLYSTVDISRRLLEDNGYIQ